MCIKILDDGAIEFDTSKMEEGKIYPFEAWGGKFGVRKRGNLGGIDILEFIPDKDVKSDYS